MNIRLQHYAVIQTSRCWWQTTETSQAVLRPIHICYTNPKILTWTVLWRRAQVFVVGSVADLGG